MLLLKNTYGIIEGINTHALSVTPDKKQAGAVLSEFRILGIKIVNHTDIKELTRCAESIDRR